MKVKFKKLRFKNIGSYGNVWTEINLETPRSVLIVGANGAGKSTMLDAFNFALFGEPFRDVKKGQIINSINCGETLIELEMESRGSEWKIIRGLKPTRFEIVKDGSLLERHAKVVDQQNWLETQILGFGQKSCGQIIVLGSATFMPFMRLPAGIRRRVVEDLLDVTAFADMLEIAKRMSSNCRSRISEARERERILQERERGKIELLRQARSSETARREDLELKYEELMTRMSTLVDNESLLCESIVQFDKSISRLDKLELTVCRGDKVLDDLRLHRERAERELTILKSEPDLCARCGQSFPVPQETIDAKKAEIDQLIEDRHMVSKRLAPVVDEVESFDGIRNKKSKAENSLSDIRGEMRSIARWLREIEDKLKSETKSVNLDFIQKEIEEVRFELREKLAKIEEEQIELRRLNVAVNVLKDDGVKSKIVKTYVPLINACVNKNLRALNFDVSFNLDENFDETIKSRGRDEFTYNSFSEGEKRRIDLALMFAWREIAKMKNSVSTNLVILDEIADGSLDADGVGDFVELLKSAGDGGTAFVISHRGEIFGLLDETIMARKKRGFSEIVTDENEIREFIESRR